MNPSADAAPLIAAEHLVKHFARRGRAFGASNAVKAVDGISLSVFRSETLALVGESGCGKSTTGRMMLRLIEPTAGRVMFEGEDILSLPPDEMRSLRRRLQIVFQDPYSSLNPRMTVGEILEDPLRIHRMGNRVDRRDRIVAMLESVGLRADHADRYPHEFSGGQRQRIGIARALILEPQFIVCDEPVSALDVSIQAQITNLLKRVQTEHGLSYLFISHDLSVVKHMADRVAVMYLGRVVEVADKRTLYAAPGHPYTRALLAAIPVPDPERRPVVAIKGEPPDPSSVSSGCRFRLQCPFAQPICAEQEPILETVGPGHAAACHFLRKLPDLPRPAPILDITASLS